MTYVNTQTSYGSIAKSFHWLLFFLILIMLGVGFSLGLDLVTNPALRKPLLNIHKLVGLLVLLLMLLRGLWALLNIKPALPPTLKRWERAAERVVHILLYITLIAMPLSGWVMAVAAGKPPHIGQWNIALPGIPISKPLSHAFFNIHAILAVAIMVLVGIHILAALKHYFYDRDNVLQTMWPGM